MCGFVLSVHGGCRNYTLYFFVCFYIYFLSLYIICYVFVTNNNLIFIYVHFYMISVPIIKKIDFKRLFFFSLCLYRIESEARACERRRGIYIYTRRALQHPSPCGHERETATRKREARVHTYIHCVLPQQVSSVFCCNLY